jgi:KH domain-containing protein
MKIIPCEDTALVTKAKKRLESALNVKIITKKGEIEIDGSPEDEFIAEKVIDAINFGFPFQVALSIKKDDNLFEILNIKDYTHRKDLETIRARIIGTKGKTFRTLNHLTECNFEIKGNEVGIIGSPECIENAQNAIIFIIQGSKQANVYAFLEKHQVKPIIDLGLKGAKKEEEKSKKEG